MRTCDHATRYGELQNEGASAFDTLLDTRSSPLEEDDREYCLVFAGDGNPVLACASVDAPFPMVIG